MKKQIVWLFFALALVLSPVALVSDGVRSAARAESSFNQTLSKPVTVKTREHGNSRINLRDGFTIPVNYAGGTAQILENNTARSLSLASADFDEDGMPNLIGGYAANEKGIITIQRGNVDLLFPSAEQQRQRDEGKVSPSPFLPLSPSFEIPIEPDFLGAGDFDADGHWDLIAARHGGDKIYFIKGDGRGNFSAIREKAIRGAITALATGEINRRDGLTDIAIGISAENHSQVLILESPDGAFQAQPEIFALPENAAGFAFGQFDANYEMDLAVANGRNLTVVHGRDRKLSLDRIRQAEVKEAKLTRQNFGFNVKAITASNCGMRNAECGLALLGADAAIHLLEREQTNNWRQSKVIDLPSMPQNLISSLIPARISASTSDDLIVLNQNQINIGTRPTTDEGQRTKDEILSLDVEGEPIAALPMRLNKDALSDLVILREGESQPSVVLTAPTAVFTVNLRTNEGDANAQDGVCDVDLATPGSQCTFRAAREQANYCPSPGPNPCGRNDEIRFNLSGAEPFVIDWYPVNNIHTITIDGYTQPGASPNTLPNGDNAVLKIQITGPGGGIGTAVVFSGGNSVVRGLVFNNFCGRTAIGLGGTGNHIAEGNFTGTDTTGSVHVGCSGSQGIAVSTTTSNTIGGTTPQARNLLTDNGVGIDLVCSNCLIQGNFIGTDRTGMQPLGGGNGIDVTAFPFSGTNNTIGGTLPGARNIISGNFTGIQIQTSGNLVQGNYIGVDVTGARALRNILFGIELRYPGGSGTSNLLVGGTTPAARNVISANGGDGIASSASALVQGNFIGTDVTGTVIDPDGIPNNGDELGNGRDGIFVSYKPNNIIGGLAPGARNIISGNRQNGVQIINNPGDVSFNNLV